MVNEKAIGILPLVTGTTFSGMMLTRLFTIAGQTGWGSMVILRPLIGVVGGVAAMVVGSGILLEWNGFDTYEEPTSRVKVALAISAVVAFAFGGILAIT